MDLCLLLLKTTFNFTKHRWQRTMIVCVCKGVSDRDLAQAIGNGARSVEDVVQCTRAGSGCGSCHQAIQDAIDMAHRPGRRLVVLPALAAAALTTG